MFSLQPLGKTFLGVPVAVLFAVIAYHDTLCVNTFTFHEGSKPIGSHRERWHTIITYERIGKYHDLTSIGWVGQTLGIPHHGGIEDHFTSYSLVIAEAIAMKLSSIL